MLVERQFQRDYAYIQQETYIKHKRMMELQRLMEELKPFPMQKSQGYNNGLLANGSRGQQLTQIECYTIASSLNSMPTVQNGQSYFSEGSASRVASQPKSFCRKFTKRNHVTAFGPRHAEHARRFYQSEGKKPDLRKVMVTPYRRHTYYSQSGSNNGSNVPGDPIFTSANNSTTSYTMAPMGRETLPKISRPAETVLKVAKISTKPNRMKPKTSACVGLSFVNNNIDDGLTEMSDDFQGSRIEIDLKNAPLFQILCEISKN